MSFQIVWPYSAAMSLDGDSFKDALKQYAKMKHDLSINSLIITDQYRYMRANLNYYNQGPKRKVGITITPTAWPLGPQVSYDTRDYPAETYITGDFPRIVPILPPLIADTFPFVPSLIRY
jgi:hypothetical protein